MIHLVITLALLIVGVYFLFFNKKDDKVVSRKQTLDELDTEEKILDLDEEIQKREDHIEKRRKKIRK